MAIYIAPKNKVTKDGRKYFYKFQYDNKQYKSKLFKTKAEVIKAEKEHISELKNITIAEEKEEIIEKHEMTFKELYDDFFRYKQDKVKQTTLYSYRMRIPHFALLYDRPVKELNTDDYLKWRSYIVKQGLGIRTLNWLMKLLKELLNYAYKWYDINNRHLYNRLENFVDADALPEEMKFYTMEEFIKFISVVDDLKYICIFELLFYCGLRRGELLGLTWKNVDLEENVIHIKNNVVVPHNGKDSFLLTSPKNRPSIRTIPIPKVLSEHLTLYKKEVKKFNRRTFRVNWFVCGKSTPLSPRTLAGRKDKYENDSGVKHIRIHDFRHSCASLLINNGASVLIVAKYLGHAKLEETLNTYSHLYDNKLKEITNIIDGLDI